MQLVESVYIPDQVWQPLGLLLCPCLLTCRLLPPWLAVYRLRALWVLCCFPPLLSSALVLRSSVMLSMHDVFDVLGALAGRVCTLCLAVLGNHSS